MSTSLGSVARWTRRHANTQMAGRCIALVRGTRTIYPSLPLGDDTWGQTCPYDQRECILGMCVAISPWYWCSRRLRCLLRESRRCRHRRRLRRWAALGQRSLVAAWPISSRTRQWIANTPCPLGCGNSPRGAPNRSGTYPHRCSCWSTGPQSRPAHTRSSARALSARPLRLVSTRSHSRLRSRWWGATSSGFDQEAETNFAVAPLLLRADITSAAAQRRPRHRRPATR